MVETVKARPNHYEALGLKPGATSDEIDQAFAREVNLIALRPLGTFARVSAAYEALRDPVRRMAYDATLAPPPRPSHPLIGRLERAPVEDSAFASTSSTKPAPPSPPPVSEPVAAPLADEPLPPSREPLAPDIHRKQWIEFPDQYLADEVDSDRGRRRSLVITTGVGGLLLLAIVIGAWTGLQSGSADQQAQPSVTADLPISLPAPSPPSAAQTIPASSSSESKVDRPEVNERAPVRPAPARPPLQIKLPDEVSPNAAPADEAAASANFPAESSAPAVEAAKLPLPDATIARTIARIGYACGQVASTVPIEGGAPGTFKVTCTSGDSYRAAPVNGRYRFRRLGG